MATKKPWNKGEYLRHAVLTASDLRLLPDLIGHEVVVLFFVVVALLAAFLVLLWLAFRR